MKEGSPHRKICTYTLQQKMHEMKIKVLPMYTVGFEPEIPVFERSKTGRVGTVHVYICILLLLVVVLVVVVVVVVAVVMHSNNNL